MLLTVAAPMPRVPVKLLDLPPLHDIVGPLLGLNVKEARSTGWAWRLTSVCFVVWYCLPVRGGGGQVMSMKVWGSEYGNREEEGNVFSKKHD